MPKLERKFFWFFAGLSKGDLELSEKKHIELLEGTGAVSTRLVIKRQDGLYTSTHLVRRKVDPDDFIEVDNYFFVFAGLCF